MRVELPRQQYAVSRGNVGLRLRMMGIDAAMYCSGAARSYDRLGRRAASGSGHGRLRGALDLSGAKPRRVIGGYGVKSSGGNDRVAAAENASVNKAWPEIAIE